MWFGRLLVDEGTERHSNPSICYFVAGFCYFVVIIPTEAEYEGRAYLGLWFQKESPQ